MNIITEILELGHPKSKVIIEGKKEIKTVYTFDLIKQLNEQLRLHSVVWQGEPCDLLHSTDWNGKCFKCGEQVFVREPK